MSENNIAIIATGRIGKMYGRLIEKIPHLKLKTVIDKYETKTSLGEQGITTEFVSANPDDLYRDSSIDKVIVAASTTSHVELCDNLIDAGKHVFCEKPLSFDYRTINRIGEKAKEKGVVLQIGYVRRFDSNYRELKKRIDNKEAGKIYMIKIIDRDPLRPPIEFAKKSGGIFMDFLVHDFDTLCYLTGTKIEKIYAEADVKVEPKLKDLNDFDTVLLTAKLSDGTMVSIDCSRETGYGSDNRVEVFGSAGCLRMENVMNHEVALYSSNGVNSAKPKADYQARFCAAFEHQLAGFLACVQNNGVPLCPFSDAAHNVRVAVACMVSKQENRPVYIDWNANE